MATQPISPTTSAIPATMPAAYIEHTGPAEAIIVGGLPVPQPGPRQVLVRVAAVAVNPVDTYIRARIAAVLPLSQAAEAQRMVERHAVKGRVVLRVDEDHASA